MFGVNEAERGGGIVSGKLGSSFAFSKLYPWLLPFIAIDAHTSKTGDSKFLGCEFSELTGVHIIRGAYAWWGILKWQL